MNWIEMFLHDQDTASVARDFFRVTTRISLLQMHFISQ